MLYENFVNSELQYVWFLPGSELESKYTINKTFSFIINSFTVQFWMWLLTLRIIFLNTKSMCLYLCFFFFIINKWKHIVVLSAVLQHLNQGSDVKKSVYILSIIGVSVVITNSINEVYIVLGHCSYHLNCKLCLSQSECWIFGLRLILR